MEHIRRKFSVPSLDEPFDHEFTEMIYDEQEADYKRKNGGKPFNSFIVSRIECGTSSDYIRSMKEAEMEVKRRIGRRLRQQIESSEDHLGRLLKDLDKFSKGGIEAFEVKENNP